jgi:hypothetical protein
MTCGSCFGANCRELIPARCITIIDEQSKNPLSFHLTFMILLRVWGMEEKA